MIIFVSESQSQNKIILGRYLPLAYKYVHVLSNFCFLPLRLWVYRLYSIKNEAFRNQVIVVKHNIL
jgi:hypothetical protein